MCVSNLHVYHWCIDCGWKRTFMSILSKQCFCPSVAFMTLMSDTLYHFALIPKQIHLWFKNVFFGYSCTRWSYWIRFWKWNEWWCQSKGKLIYQHRTLLKFFYEVCKIYFTLGWQRGDCISRRGAWIWRWNTGILQYFSREGTRSDWSVQTITTANTPWTIRRNIRFAKNAR